MQIILSPEAKQGSTYIVLASFTDEAGDPVVPNSILWSLTDTNGTVINSRKDIEVPPDSSISIVLSADDIDDNNGAYFIVTITAEYNSSTYGSNLPLIDQGKFKISDFTDII